MQQKYTKEELLKWLKEQKPIYLDECHQANVKPTMRGLFASIENIACSTTFYEAIKGSDFKLFKEEK